MESSGKYVAGVAVRVLSWHKQFFFVVIAGASDSHHSRKGAPMHRRLAVVALVAVALAATPPNCQDKTITRKETATLTRDARAARVTLDVLVDRDLVVGAALSAAARGNFGGSDGAAKVANVTTTGASVRCADGDASQCSTWYACGEATDASTSVVAGVVVADVTVSDAVEFDYTACACALANP